MFCVCPDEVKSVFEEPREKLPVKLPLRLKRRRSSPGVVCDRNANKIKMSRVPDIYRRTL